MRRWLQDLPLPSWNRIARIIIIINYLSLQSFLEDSPERAHYGHLCNSNTLLATPLSLWGVPSSISKMSVVSRAWWDTLPVTVDRLLTWTLISSHGHFSSLYSVHQGTRLTCRACVAAHGGTMGDCHPSLRSTRASNATFPQWLPFSHRLQRPQHVAFFALQTSFLFYSCSLGPFCIKISLSPLEKPKYSSF